MGHLNNIPIAYTVKSDADFHYQPSTPSHFLMGSAYNELQPEDGKAGLLSRPLDTTGSVNYYTYFGNN
jgi:hypothetical protein